MSFADGRDRGEGWGDIYQKNREEKGVITFLSTVAIEIDF